MSGEHYVLDSYAVLCYLQDEPGADEVALLLDKAWHDKAELYMTWINFGEVYYRIWRKYGKEDAVKIAAILQEWPLELLAADKELSLLAASVKAENLLSYADAFAIATAIMVDGVLVTGDQEILKARDKLNFKILWLEA